jgi:membrane-associated phospholipid phosphatase
MEILTHQGIEFILFLQSLGSWLDAPMLFFSFLGNEDFYLLILPIVFWMIDDRLGLRIGVILMLGTGIDSLVKLAFHSPRPYWLSTQVEAKVTESTFGIPSGHAFNAATVWGMIGAYIKRMWGWIAVGVLIFLIGLSRMYNGVHFPVDVVIGWLLGLAVLWAFLRWEKPVVQWMSHQRLAANIGVVFLISVISIFGAQAIKSTYSEWQIPTQWIENAAVADPSAPPIQPQGLKDIITAAGAFFGLGAGALWLYSRYDYSIQGTWNQRLLRYPLGVIGVLILYFGLGLVFPSGEHLTSYLLRYLRYALVGVWITGMAPWLFLRFNLVGSRDAGQEEGNAP